MLLMISIVLSRQQLSPVFSGIQTDTQALNYGTCRAAVSRFQVMFLYIRTVFTNFN